MEGEAEPTQFDRNRSRLRDLGLPEPDPQPPKTVAAPQHCQNHQLFKAFTYGTTLMTGKP